MSTENQNGTATGLAQANGLKTSLSSLTSSTTSITSNTSRSTTNSSFLYSSNSLLGSRVDKPRQPPPPTLPKYTSSFNAGTNGTADRLSKDRETGGSYRLASLDRLAMRQRILDGDKPNGDANSVKK